MSTKEQSSSLTVLARTKCKRRWKVTRLTGPVDGTREYHQNSLYQSFIELGKWACAWKMGEWRPEFKNGDRQEEKNYIVQSHLLLLSIRLCSANKSLVNMIQLFIRE